LLNIIPIISLLLFLIPEFWVAILLGHFITFKWLLSPPPCAHVLWVQQNLPCVTYMCAKGGGSRVTLVTANLKGKCPEHTDLRHKLVSRRKRFVSLAKCYSPALARAALLPIKLGLASLGYLSMQCFLFPTSFLSFI